MAETLWLLGRSDYIDLIERYNTHEQSRRGSDRERHGPLKHLGAIVPPEHLHNIAWVNAEGRTLCMCAKTGLYRVRLNIPGIRL